METKTSEPKKQEIIELERVYIYPNDMRPGEVMKRYIMNVTGITARDDGGHIVHTTSGDEYVGAGWLRIMHKVPKAAV